MRTTFGPAIRMFGARAASRRLVHGDQAPRLAELLLRLGDHLLEVRRQVLAQILKMRIVLRKPSGARRTNCRFAASRWLAPAIASAHHMMTE